jgi:hypothetical protein
VAPNRHGRFVRLWAQRRHITHGEATRCLWSAEYFETSTHGPQRARNRAARSRTAIDIVDWADRRGPQAGGHRLNGKWHRDAARNGSLWPRRCARCGVSWCLGRTRHCSVWLPVAVHRHPPPAIRGGPSEAAQRAPTRGGRMAIIDRRLRGVQPTTVMPLLISFVQAMQPRTGPCVGEQN